MLLENKTNVENPTNDCWEKKWIGNEFMSA